MIEDINAGRRLMECNPSIYSQKDWNIILVNGANFNVFDHAILNIGGHGGHYAHISSGHIGSFFPGTFPLIMDQHDYEVYKVYHGKRELLREQVIVPCPARAILKLEQIYMDRWKFGAVFHNCATMVEEILQAGGCVMRFPCNLPKKARELGFNAACRI